MTKCAPRRIKSKGRVNNNLIRDAICVPVTTFLLENTGSERKQRPSISSEKKIWATKQKMFITCQPNGQYTT